MVSKGTSKRALIGHEIKTPQPFVSTILSGNKIVSLREDPYRYYTWTITYGTPTPLGIPQQVILINGQFLGPQLEVVTNDYIILNLINKLDEPFLLTWNDIKQRKNSWQDGVLGTNCPIPPNSNYTYKFQTKDQIGTYTYFPSTAMHKAGGGYGGRNVYKRAPIPLPYHFLDGDFNFLDRYSEVFGFRERSSLPGCRSN
ncbi:hypothetical protein IFM89_027450 [Coptis chinensis]|uniref:Plastocyanin-like domain-containing protein n=1 Tax=Coptis chinensis TaxID=261450 RepID=A0A835I5W7_9MAGN|nr:hypothetical protein IFM89_027450 [Coptis chinensis]